MSQYDRTLYKVSLAPGAVTDGTDNGTAVDRAVNGGMQDATLIVTTGAVTDGSHAVTVQDSADGTTGWTAVSASLLQGSLPTVVEANDSTVFEVGIGPTRRYLRAVIVTTGATTGGVIGCHFALSAPRYSPVTR
ncbi:hypothetical protein ABZ070_02360 [Streptomyces sp. NPDC006283]|uniref:hypothetical protein n=1 Tax=Streptomyces sp. NPDC006283 TaxID=3156741 RepID=UPI0033BEBEEF